MTVDVSPKPPKPQNTYLGDGVYATFDGYQVLIWTSNGIHESPKIALEPSVMANLIRYAENVGGL